MNDNVNNGATTMNDNVNNGATTMNNNTNNGARNMNAVWNNDKSGKSFLTKADVEEMHSPMVARERKCATPPMTPEEERAAFQEMKAAEKRGDDARRRIVRDRIFNSMILLVLKITRKTVEWHRRKFSKSSITFMDYLHGGYSALCNAIDEFNPDKGVRLSTYAYKAIVRKQNEMAHVRNWNKGDNALLSLEEEYGEDWATKLSDTIAANCEPVDSQVSRNTDGAAAWACLEILSKRERDCLFARYDLRNDDSLLADVADKYGITAARVSQITKEAVKKLRAQFAA